MRAHQPSASSWIRAHADFTVENKKAHIQSLMEGAKAAGFDVTFAGANSAYYAARGGKKRQARQVEAAPQQRTVNTVGVVIRSITKELEVLQAEVQRLQKIESAHHRLLAAVEKVRG